jgi:hypothetical protein
LAAQFPGQSRLAGNQDKLKERFNLGADCPVFDHIIRYCQVGGWEGLFGVIQGMWRVHRVAENIFPYCQMWEGAEKQAWMSCEAVGCMAIIIMVGKPRLVLLFFLPLPPLAHPSPPFLRLKALR